MACGQLENKAFDPNEVVFATTDASKLFFKNTRAFYYIKEELPQAKLEIYRWKDEPENEQHQLKLALVNNWRFDEAYLLIEPSEAIDLNTLKVRWQNQVQSGEITFTPGNKSEHARFAGLLYQQIKKESQFEILVNNKWQPFLTDAISIKAFETTVYDFYRLTERL